MSRYLFGLLIVVGAFLGGCREGGNGPAQIPEGWTGDGDKWWLDGADTTGAFPRLEDFESMGLASRGPVYASRREIGNGAELRRDQIIFAVRRSLLPLYRNEPQIVDSLFELAVVPELRELSLDQSPDALIERNKKRAYAIMRKHFREPSPKLSLGKDIPVVYPDSLRKREIGGAVRLQVRLNQAGEPVAIRLTDSVHPVLDQIAVRATMRMRWVPAFVLVRRDWRPMPSWARFAIHFTTAR